MFPLYRTEFRTLQKPIRYNGNMVLAFSKIAPYLRDRHVFM